MLLSEHKDLKLEIRSLPEKEKDKLLLRLIAKDKVLTEHLHYKLLEDESDLASRYEKLLSAIDDAVSKLLSNTKLNAKETLLQVRKLNGCINHHYKVTKDINTEIELRVHLLNKVPLIFKEGIFSAMHQYNGKLNIYIVKSAVSVLNKYKKLHEDLQYDLAGALNSVLNKIYNNKTAAIAQELGLPKVL